MKKSPSISCVQEFGSSRRYLASILPVRKSRPKRNCETMSRISFTVYEDSFSVVWWMTTWPISIRLRSVDSRIFNETNEWPCASTTARPCSSWHTGNIPVYTVMRPSSSDQCSIGSWRSLVPTRWGWSIDNALIMYHIHSKVCCC